MAPKLAMKRPAASSKGRAAKRPAKAEPEQDPNDECFQESDDSFGADDTSSGFNGRHEPKS